jgi:hypothetical protein
LVDFTPLFYNNGKGPNALGEKFAVS